ncbi:hypothetical protein ACFPJ4_04745 [Lysinimonas soli]|uniref:Secreted protein n=1 Tax=Lysinimonas soli TaxID=1074233 RepID=A0ABW0NQK1_9MICO
MRARYPVAAVGVVSALLLTGCTAGATSSSRTPTAAAAASAPALPAGVTQATAVPTDVPNDTAARKNVTITSCAANDGGWAAKGTVANLGDGPKTYTITVFFTTSTATVLHTDAVTVSVKPGQTADWTIDGKFVAPAGTRCVLRGVG